jgi:hypothetical protein
MAPLDERKQLHIKLSEAEFDALQKIASDLGISLTDYVRYALHTRMKRDVAQIDGFKGSKRNEVRAMGAYMQAIVESERAEMALEEAKKAYSPPEEHDDALTPQQRALRAAPGQLARVVSNMGKKGGLPR